MAAAVGAQPAPLARLAVPAGLPASSATAVPAAPGVVVVQPEAVVGPAGGWSGWVGPVGLAGSVGVRAALVGSVACCGVEAAVVGLVV